ncbi:protein of unknown function [Kyrpidia spormannii]|uniref:Uncharacterized protein n=1 Tax=Kyrpidia spormannii TaxID=2055160 RepID=A0A6F9EF87_9BACL|nr:protein of unknown function [Kyrpidia spormannii]
MPMRNGNICANRSLFGHAFVRSVPMRNGNICANRSLFGHAFVRSVPMRNGNSMPAKNKPNKEEKFVACL